MMHGQKNIKLCVLNVSSIDYVLGSFGMILC